MRAEGARRPKSCGCHERNHTDDGSNTPHAYQLVTPPTAEPARIVLNLEGAFVTRLWTRTSHPGEERYEVGAPAAAGAVGIV
jgi:hypothetical protein